MVNYTEFEPIFGEWYVDGPITQSDRETVLRAHRERNGAKEYCAIKHIPVPTDEETLQTLISGGMDEATIDAYVEDRLRDANREIAIAERVKGHDCLMEYEETATLPREGSKGCDIFIRMGLYGTLERMAEKKAFTRGEAAKLAGDIASALDVFASQGIVHRNVTPDNIFVGPEGFKLGGFSRARVKGVSGDDYPDAEERAYSAPELMKGEGRSEATDVYSLGMILYRLMNRGRLPFLPLPPEPATKEQTEAAVLRRIAGAKLPEPADAGGDLGSVILTACAYDPAERFRTARAMLNALGNMGGAVLPSQSVEEPVFDEEPKPEPTPEKVLPEEAKPEKAVKAKPEKEKKRAKAEEKKDKEKDKEKKSGKGLKTAITIFAIIAGLALLGIAGYFVKGAIDDYLADKEANAFKPRPPSIIQDTEDPDIYHVTIYAENGTAVVYETPSGTRRQYMVKDNNCISFDLRGSELIPDEPLESTAYSVQPRFFTRNSENELVPVSDMGYIMLEVPQLSMSFDAGVEIFTDDGSVKIKGHIEDRGAKVEADGDPLVVTADGDFVYQTQIDQNGEYQIVITAKKPRYASATEVFTVTVGIPEAPVIQMPWDYGDTTYAQRVADPGDTVRVFGRVPEGAMLLAEPDSEEVVINEITVSDDGSFGFDAVISEIGDFTITLKCTDASGIASERRIHVQRAPEWRSYVEGAWAMNYDALTRPGTHAYNVKGKVTEVIEHIDHYEVMLETSDGSTLKLIYHQHYPNSNKLEVGREYQWIYGYPMGRDASGAPTVYVWFVNDRG